MKDFQGNVAAGINRNSRKNSRPTKNFCPGNTDRNVYKILCMEKIVGNIFS